MKKVLSTLCATGIFFWLATVIQAEDPHPSGLWEIVAGECYLDGYISPPHKSIDGMDGFEVPLVANWSPVQLNEGTYYRGDAKFGVYNFKVGEGELIDAYLVDVDLHRDDPGLSEEERHNLFIYRCKDGSNRCTATLATVKQAITEQIARDYSTDADHILYQEDARVNFLGVFVKVTDPPGKRAAEKSGQIYLHTEVCGASKIIMAEALPH
jgi:hypothetical protein